MNTWRTLPRPFVGLAPMDGITDTFFRQITALYGKPDVMFTEFAHVQGLWQGKLSAYEDVYYEANERPLIAQVFGSEPEYFYKVAHIICELGFDGLDINMGCPANSVIKRGGGGALINTPDLAKRIIQSTQKGVFDWVNGQTLKDLGLDGAKIEYISHIYHSNNTNIQRIPIPVSIKTRLGYDKPILKEWLSHVIECQPDAITVHGRTLKQLYSGKADWETLGSVADMLHTHNIVFIGNGDISSLEDAKLKANTYGCDGVLIGRAALGNPWLFSGITPTMHQRIQGLKEHTRRYVSLHGKNHFHELYKHFGWYCKNFKNAKDLRVDLITKAKSLEDVEKITASFM